MCSDSRRPMLRPGLAAVGGLVDAVADRHAVAHPALARPDPDRLGVLGIDRDRADRLHRLLVEHRLERGAAVHRLPHAAARRADIHGETIALVHGGDRRDAAAHRRRADVPRAESRRGRRIHARPKPAARADGGAPVRHDAGCGRGGAGARLAARLRARLRRGEQRVVERDVRLDPLPAYCPFSALELPLGRSPGRRGGTSPAPPCSRRAPPRTRFPRRGPCASPRS